MLTMFLKSSAVTPTTFIVAPLQPVADVYQDDEICAKDLVVLVGKYVSCSHFFYLYFILMLRSLLLRVLPRLLKDSQIMRAHASCSTGSRSSTHIHRPSPVEEDETSMLERGCRQSGSCEERVKGKRVLLRKFSTSVLFQSQCCDTQQQDAPTSWGTILRCQIRST
jgi:hypothetical protein